MVGALEILEVYERVWKSLMSGDRIFSGEIPAVFIDLCRGGESLHPSLTAGDESNVESAFGPLSYRVICYRFIVLTISSPQGYKGRACRTDTRQRETPELLRHIKSRLTRTNRFISKA